MIDVRVDVALTIRVDMAVAIELAGALVKDDS